MIGIIGGTGLYQLEGVEIIEEIEVSTPFGEVSSIVSKLKWGKYNFFFLPRHGRGHGLLPEEINYRANIYALKSLGVKQVISISAVGSLKKEYEPGSFVIPNQYFDFIKGPRKKSFFGEGMIAHISTAETVCLNLSQSLKNLADKLDFKLNLGGIYASVDGPRLGTKAESFFLKDAVNADLVGMTNVPEVFLAREAQLCYASLCIITDYDCWSEGEEANTKDIFAMYAQSLGKVQNILKEFFEQSTLPTIDENFRKSLTFSLVTPIEKFSTKQKEIWEILSQ